MVATLLVNAPEPLEGRGYVLEPPPARARFGLSAGTGGGAYLVFDPEAWWTAEFAALLDLDLRGRLVSLRFGAPLRAGTTFRTVPESLFSAGLRGEARLALGDRLGLGLGVEASLMFVAVGGADARLFASFGLSATILSVRLGEQRNHELALSALALVQTDGNGPSGLAFVRYAYLF